MPHFFHSNLPHDRSECDEFAIIPFCVAGLKCRGVFFPIIAEGAHAFAKILDGIGDALCIGGRVNHPHDFAFGKTARFHHLGNVGFFHPLQPVVVAGGFNFYGHVVNNHTWVSL